MLAVASACDVYHKRHANLVIFDQINTKLSYASDVTSSHSKCDMRGIQQAGKGKLVLKPKAHSFYTTYMPHYEPLIIETSPNFWFLGNPEP